MASRSIPHGRASERRELARLISSNTTVQVRAEKPTYKHEKCHGIDKAAPMICSFAYGCERYGGAQARSARRVDLADDHTVLRRNTYEAPTFQSPRH